MKVAINNNTNSKRKNETEWRSEATTRMSKNKSKKNTNFQCVKLIIIMLLYLQYQRYRDRELVLQAFFSKHCCCKVLYSLNRGYRALARKQCRFLKTTGNFRVHQSGGGLVFSLALIRDAFSCFIRERS